MTSESDASMPTMWAIRVLLFAGFVIDLDTAKGVTAVLRVDPGSLIMVPGVGLNGGD